MAERLTARRRLRATLVAGLPGWTVGEWTRGALVCRRGEVHLSVTDCWRKPDDLDPGGRWHGWALEAEADSEYGGDWCQRRQWPEWAEDFARDILAAVGRLGTRETCGRCSGTGLTHSLGSCGTCDGQGVVVGPGDAYAREAGS